MKKGFIIRLVLSMILEVLFFFCMNSKVWADPFFSYPGTRARAMGGAFVAVADDSSAGWYNPAGVATTQGIDFSIEFSQAPTFNETWKYSNEGISYFFGGKVSKQESGGTVGEGAYWYKPYNIRYSYNITDDSGYYDYITGTLNETIKILGYVFGVGNDILKVGVDFELVFLDFDSNFIGYNSHYSEESFIGYNSYYSEENSTSSQCLGVSASFGLLLIPINIEEHGFGLRIGAVYRLPSVGNLCLFISDYEQNITDKVIFKKPASYDLGVALQIPINRLILTLSGQYGEVDYSEANKFLNWKYKRTAIGGELIAVVRKDTILSLRAGKYKSKPTVDEVGEVSGLTAGVGVGIAKYFIEGTWEKRTWEESTINLISISLNFAF